MILDDLLNSGEIVELERLYGSFPRRHHRLAVGSEHIEWWADKVLNDRRGEVVLAVQGNSGEVLLHTKSSYPPGIYRLLSGGVSWGEGVATALRREVYEETGYQTFDEQFLGLVSYEFHCADCCLPFVSYVYLLTGIKGQPVVQDEEEEISAFRWAPVSELAVMAAALRSVPEDSPGFRDWGRFRALAHDFLFARIKG